MTVLLSRPYGGNPAGATVTFDPTTETYLVRNGFATSTSDASAQITTGGIGNTATPTPVTAGAPVATWYGLSGAVVTTVAPIAANPGDGVANAVNTVADVQGNQVRQNVRPEVFNGTTHDRMRGDTNGIAIQPALSSTFWNYAPPINGIVNTTTAVTVKAAAGAGVRNYISIMQIDTDTLGAASELVIRDGAAGTVLWRGKVQAAVSGRFVKFDPPLRGTANTLVEVATLTATVTGSVLVNLQGYTGA